MNNKNKVKLSALNYVSKEFTMNQVELSKFRWILTLINGVFVLKDGI